MFETVSGKRFFVTGADGFIGSHLVELLVELGAEVRALVFYNSWNEIGWLKDIPEQVLSQVEIVRGDVRDGDHMRELVKGCDYVMHLSSLIAIPYSYHAPRSYVETNINGALNILQACRESDSLTRLVHVSTSETYGSAQYVPIDEKHPLQPQSPYSASKIGADAIAHSFYSSFDLALTIARPFNTYGPRQSARAVIPTIIAQIASGIKEIKLGDLTPTRDFNFVKDTCNGLLKISENNSTIGLTLNIGSGTEVSIFDTLTTIKDIMNSEVKFITDSVRVRPKKSEVFRLCCDNSLLKQHTSFKSKYTLESGLKETIDWILIPNNLRKYKAEIYNI